MEPTVVPVAVAIVTDDPLRRVLVDWNDNWGVFTLPMTKVRPAGSLVRPEEPGQAALRAAAEVLGVPVQLVNPPLDEPLRRRNASLRERQVKRYDHHLFRVEPHPDFTAQLFFRRPHLWVSPYLLLERVYQPMSASVEPLIRHVLQALWLPERVQPTTTLLLTRTANTGLEFLLRWNPNWNAYTLPAKRRPPDSTRSSAELAADVAHRELDVAVPGLTVLPDEIVLDGIPSGNVNPPLGLVPTRYLHLVARGNLSGTEPMRSDEPLHWATAEEVVQRQTAALRSSPGSPAGQPGRISSTVREIAGRLGLLKDAISAEDDAEMQRLVEEYEARARLRSQDE